jgi:orotidine-5'-phosphate decarboxylase
MTDALTELLKTGAQALIASAVEAELAGYIAQFSELRTDAGHVAVVHNGHHPARTRTNVETQQRRQGHRLSDAS